MSAEKEQQIDQKYLDKQSRTIGTYGLETMAKLIHFKVLIVGCGGVGVEIAKNLALAGVHSVFLYDPRRPTVRDMGVNFAVSNAALQSNRSMAEISANYIADLNPNTRVRAVPELTKEAVSACTALIFTASAPDLSLKTLCSWNEFCRTHTPTISFFLALQMGAVGSVFADHGNAFTVKDADGRPMLQKAITEVVTKTDKAGHKYTRIRFETPEGQTAGALRSYTRVKLSEVQGLTKADGTSVNGHVFDGVVCPSDPRDTVRVYPSFEAAGYSSYKTGGFLHEEKEVTTLAFRSLQDAIHSPGEFVPVSPMMDNSEESQTHILTNALLRFAEEHNGSLPALHETSEAQSVVDLANRIISENRSRPKPSAPAVDEAKTPINEEFPATMPPPPPAQPLVLDAINESAISVAAQIARAELQPLASFFGAVVAQEVVKITGKYSPIHQWFHLSSETVLRDDVKYNTDEFTPCNSRYDNLIAILGKSFTAKLQSLNIFMVGCGALGCENIKNFALCGITCGGKGSLVVTDNDRIEVSNLSRQFLFREDNVGQPKSVAAAARMKLMNPDCVVDARQDFVGPATEHLFPDTFWTGVDVVVNALDNMEARLYVDQQCVRFHKVLVEAGTMGTGGNVDIIVPGKTSSYSDGGGADQSGGIPMCTLRNFPYIFDHCIEWARAQFDDLFVSPMQTAQQLLENPKAFSDRIMGELGATDSAGERLSTIEKNLGQLRTLKRTLSILVDGPTVEKCEHLAWDVLFNMFRDRIYDLQKAFPRDAKKKNGDPFWSGHRKYPAALEVDTAHLAKSPDAAEFLIAATNLYCCMFGVHPAKPEARFNDENHRWMSQYRSTEWLQKTAGQFPTPEYHPSVVDGLDEEAALDAKADQAASPEEVEKHFNELMQEVTTLATTCSQTKAAPLEFEKDDDDNFQIDFIAAASNLRAINYQIPTADRMKVKLVAGKIIPAIATTTSAVTGLALIELFKVLLGKDVSMLRNGMVELGTSNYVLFERDLPIKNRTKVVSTYIPEQDYTYKNKIIRVPEGFTKYDTIDVPITRQTTVQQFADALAQKLNTLRPAGAEFDYEVDGIGVGKGMLWNGRPKHPNTNLALMDVIEKQKMTEAGGSLARPFWENRTQFCDLSVAVTCDDGDTGVDEEEVETATIRLLISA